MPNMGLDLWALFKKTGVELGSDPYANRRYLAELAVVFTFLALALYVTWTLLSPLFIKSSNDFLRGAAALIYIINLFMCHQMPERSFFIFGEPLGLCHRCIGIFIGALLAYPSAGLRNRFPRFMRSLAFVIAALIPLAVDGTMQFFGMHESNYLARFSTGFIAAFAVMYYLIATILERFSTGKTFYRKGIAVPVLIPFALLVIPLIAASAFVGLNYKSAAYALEIGERLSPNESYYEVHYIPPHATQSIPADQFLSSFSDPILRDVDKNSKLWMHGLGVWVVLALNETPQRYGNYAYISNGSGDYYYIDAWSGELILHTNH